MKHALAITCTALILSFTAPASADATLTYELTEANGSKTEKKFSVSRFYVRIDNPDDKKRYLLFEAGRFFSLHLVDQSQNTYERLTPKIIPHMGTGTAAKEKSDAYRAENPPAARAPVPAPVLKPTSKKLTVAGVPCRIVNEMSDDKPVVEHCMANSANLEVTSREVITMTRLFRMARKRELGWLGVGTEDEEFFSVQSRDLRTNRVLQLTSISTKPLEQGYLQIPREYKKVEPGKKAASTSPQK